MQEIRKKTQAGRRQIKHPMIDKLLSSPHWHNNQTITGVMLQVCVALIPGILCYVWFFGVGVIIQCLLAVIFALTLEYLMLTLRRRDPALFLRDGSAIVTALLFALSISPLMPWWISLIGIAFAIIISKHVFGGLGYNLFNPAMAGYVFILLCFPAHMNAWPSAIAWRADAMGLSEYFTVIFLSPHAEFDAYSGATPLNDMQSRLGAMGMVSEIRQAPLFGHFGGVGWEWISFAFLLGGLYLLAFGVIKWRIPVALLSSVFLISLVFNMYDADLYASPLFHIFSGGTLLCAFFIATDPVSAATTPTGQILFGCLVGVLIYLIRTWGAYPDGVGFAILIANAFVPLIDILTPPKVFGER